MIKPLIPSEDPLLHKKIKNCSYDLDRQSLSYTLMENMFHHNGVGLSANQIGINERAFVMMTDTVSLDTTTCFNPRILKYSHETSEMVEGCLSYPGKEITVARPVSVVVKYENESKISCKEKLTGFVARIFQHEYDHMEGIDFTQR
tara:strand:- start:443 stop:880 length:438 start_codon:yes stop_codon:yes gene_type:complete